MSRASFTKGRGHLSKIEYFLSLLRPHLSDETVIGCRLSVIGHRLSIADYRLSIFGYLQLYSPRSLCVCLIYIWALRLGRLLHWVIILWVYAAWT